MQQESGSAAVRHSDEQQIGSLSAQQVLATPTPPPPPTVRLPCQQRTMPCTTTLPTRSLNAQERSSRLSRGTVKVDAVAGFTRASDRPPIITETQFNPLATERCFAWGRWLQCSCQCCMC